MNISEKTIQFLAKDLCGDSGLVPYKTGPQLVVFFVQFRANNQYGEGFPSRWRYAEEKVREFNGTKALKNIIEQSLDPRDFIEWNGNLEQTVQAFNDFLKFDGYELKKLESFTKYPIQPDFLWNQLR